MGTSTLHFNKIALNRTNELFWGTFVIKHRLNIRKHFYFEQSTITRLSDLKTVGKKK